jgi:hypothetical protein
MYIVSVIEYNLILMREVLLIAIWIVRPRYIRMMQRVLSQRTPIQDDFIHQLPQANEQNFQNQPGIFVWGDDYDHVYYQQNGVIHEAPQEMIDSAIAALGAFYGN